MKKIVAFMLVGLLLSFGTAHALSSDGFWLGPVNTGATNDGTINNVEGLDWSSSGSGNAQGFGANGTLNLQPGTDFTFRYQAYLAGFTTDGGGSLTAANLNNTYEFTVVATIPETLQSLTLTPPTGLPATALIKTLAGGTFGIYMDTANANVATGTGFDDGTLVAQGTILPDQISVFTLLTSSGSTSVGLGSVILEGLVTSFDSSVFGFDAATGLPIFDFRVESNLNIPPLDSTTSQFFAGGSSTFFPTYTVDTATDTQFKVDASSKFSVQAVPEPSTMLLLGVGLLGLAGYTRKRMKI